MLYIHNTLYLFISSSFLVHTRKFCKCSRSRQVTQVYSQKRKKIQLQLVRVSRTPFLIWCVFKPIFEHDPGLVTFRS